MSKRTEKAEAIYSTNCNCAQSTLAAFGDLTGFDEGTALRLASSLGGGIGKTGSLCGALCGVILAAGMAKGYGYDPASQEKQALTGYIRDLAETFRERFGEINCPALLSQNEKDGLTGKACMRYVTGAVEILEAAL